MGCCGHPWHLDLGHVPGTNGAPQARGEFGGCGREGSGVLGFRTWGRMKNESSMQEGVWHPVKWCESGLGSAVMLFVLELNWDTWSTWTYSPKTPRSNQKTLRSHTPRGGTEDVPPGGFKICFELGSFDVHQLQRKTLTFGHNSFRDP